MKSISIVSTGTLKAVHGANYVLDNLVKSKSFFKEVFIKKIYSSEETLNVFEGEDMPIGKYGNAMIYATKRKIRIYFREMLSSKYLFGARIKEYFNFIKPANIVSDKVIADDDGSDWLIFQDFNSAYSYLKKREKNHTSNEPKTAMIIHQADDSMNLYISLFPAFEKGRQKERIWRKRDFVYANIDRVIYISKKAYNGSIVEESKRRMIYNGIPDISDTFHSKYEEGRINLVCVGSIAGRKGQDLIIQALHLIPKEKMDGVKLYLVGDGSERLALEKMAKDFGLENEVEFLGVRKDVAAILSTMDVFIMPSFNEGLSISSLEALRAGLYLMLTDVGGNCEVMGDNCGIVVSRDPSDIAEKLEMIIDKKIISAGQKQSSIDRYHQFFSLEKMAEGYEKMVVG